MIDKIQHSMQKLETWVEKHQYKGYDPFDGLNSFLRPLAFGNLFAERILEQVVRQSPLNLRPLFGVKPAVSTKGMSYMAWGYLNRFKISGNHLYKEKAFHCLDWLDMNKAPGFTYHSWANHFDHASRSGRQMKGTPDIVWTGLTGQAYMDSYEMFKEERDLRIIKSITKWMLQLSREQFGNGICLSYLPREQLSIHNSNMVGASFLARASKITGDRTALEIGKAAMNYSCSRQLPDGSWRYGESPMHRWIDNFHTAYNLDSLMCYKNATGDLTYEENINKGFVYWINNFFEKSGRPKYYCNRVYPVDSQCISQSIDTLANFSDVEKGALDLACKVVSWAIQNMQDRDGHFYYRQYPLGIIAKAPMLHWAQATTYKALTHLLLKITE